MPATQKTEQTPTGGPIDVEALIDKHIGKVEEKQEAKAEAKPEAEIPVAAAEPAPVLEPAPKPHWRDTLIEGDDIPAYFKDKKGLKAGDLAQSFELGQAATTRAQQEAAEARRAAEDMRVRLIAMETMQRAIPQQQAAPQPEQPQVDPRLVEAARIQLEDPDRAEALRTDYHEERAQSIAKKQTADAIAALRNDMTIEQNRAIGRQALEAAMSVLELKGVSRETFTKRARALLVEVTDPANEKYYANGGPLRSDNLIGAYVDVFGLPEPPPAAQVPAGVAAAPPIVVPAAPPPPTTVPGATKPAPAAVPPPAKAPLKREVSQALESLADEFSHLKLNKDRMLGSAHEGAS